jgi:bis(5'-nucleosyl)-tetraphosphatase (symmetrical)
MSLYLIGDLQGCYMPFRQLLNKVGFSPSRDHLVCLGDLVNRGPASLEVVRQLMAWEGSAQALLGNHDLHLLAVAQGVRQAHRHDTLQALLEAPDRAALLHWLHQRPLALQRNGWLLVHAGVLPQWTAAQTLALAQEVSDVLASPQGPEWLHHMYGNQPNHWQPHWPTSDRLRVIVNALTRLRFCNAQGVMEFDTKDSASSAPPGFMPWFDVPNRQTVNTPMAFGHWSTLGLVQRPNLLALDTGCVWGGCLSAAQIGAQGQVEAIEQVNCKQALEPGQA